MSAHREFARKIQGPLVPVLTAFGDDERLDIDSTCRAVSWMLDRGIKLFWTTHGTTHFMSLTDQEIMDVTAALAKTIGNRGIFIASTPRQWATDACIEFTRFAAKHGAHVVKVQVDWNFSFSADQLLDHYSRIAAKSPLPLFAYTLGAGVNQDALARIIDIPQFIGMKNDTDDFYGQERFVAAVRKHANTDEFHIMTGGGLSTIKLNFDLGSKAYGDMTPWYSPELSIRIYESMKRGERDLLNRFLVEIEEPLFFDVWPGIGPGGHWGWGHAMAYHLGLFKSPKMRFPSITLNDRHMADAKAFLDRVAKWR